MILTIQQIKDELEHSSKSSQIRLAALQQDRIKFHVDTNVDVVESVPYSNFKNFVRSLLPADKYETMMNLLKFPIPTNKLADDIWTRLAKIYDGRNAAINFQFKSPEDRADWDAYRVRVLREPMVWSQDAWEFFKTEINGIVVVDMPEDGGDPSDDKPQPYFYFVPIESVISYSVNRITKGMDWVIFRCEDRIIAIDGASYRSFSLVDGELVPIAKEANHELGYCPARFFWNQSLSLSTPDVKKSPISKALGDLDWYLFWTLAKKHLDVYGSFPIYSGYEQECDYSNAQGDTCQKGWLVGNDGHYKTDEFGNLIPCPLCHNKKSLAGPGTYVEVPVPTGDDKDLRNPVQILTIDKKSLEYCVEEQTRLRKAIINTCVGQEASIINETSLADKQVDATYESQDTVLNRIKQGFEEIQKWVDTTCCVLRYGRDKFISANINYGTEFYTLTPEAILARYAKAKESGASDAELDAINDQLIATTYRHDPILLQRMSILADLEPYRHVSKDQMIDMFKEGIVNADILALKLDFSGYIRKFERENANILDFGSGIPYQKKIETIYKTLLDYAKQSNSGAE